MIGCFGRRPKAIEYLSTGRQAELVKSYDGGAAVVFSTCAFPVDISSTSASGKVREYPEWIANQWGGAVPGVCMHRRMASGMHEYIWILPYLRALVNMVNSGISAGSPRTHTRICCRFDNN